jgi:hypothetical protein
MFADTYTTIVGGIKRHPSSTENGRTLTSWLMSTARNSTRWLLRCQGLSLGLGCYLGCYQKAIKKIVERLDEETQVKYQAEAKKWTEQQPPPRQQQR